MRLVVPYSGDLHPADARLIRLAESWGAQCELLRLTGGGGLSPEFIERQIADKNSCFVVNVLANREWMSGEAFPLVLSNYLTTQFSFVMVHNVACDPFAANTVSLLSGGGLQSVHQIEPPDLSYEIASGYEEICGFFSGLTFGPFDRGRDLAFRMSPSDHSPRALISVCGQPFLVGIKRKRAEVFFLACADIVDIEATTAGKPLTAYFPALVPPIMLLRYMFGKECWHPNQQHATLIIDDPILRKNYGFLNYERLLGLMDEHNFHTSIAFIPHNYRRNSPTITRMFRERADRYSICYHGNDHTHAEFASKDSSLLNSMLTIAEKRMDSHTRAMGVRCDKVMVFPQGNFSSEAMGLLRARNFCAAVNTVSHPLGETPNLTFADALKPAVLAYGGFPLFLRKYVREITSQDVAFSLFFGKPLFIVEHHDIFRNPEYISQLISRIQTIAPGIRWSSLQTAIENSFLRRLLPDGTFQVRAYSNAVRVENPSDTPLRCSVEWADRHENPPEKVLVDGTPWDNASISAKSVQIMFDLAPGTSGVLSLVYQNNFDLSNSNRRFKWMAQAFLRRRLCELRDNQLSKNPRLLSFAKSLRRLFS